jgi:hypothetical protein
MITKLVLAGTATLAAVALFAVPAADAAVPGPITLHESVTFGTGHTPPVGAFTAVGLPECSSGSFRDHLNNFNLGGNTLVVDRIYTCDGGSSFLARMVLHMGPLTSDGTVSASGEWTILDGTGALAGTSGTGTTAATNSGCTDMTCETGVSTVVASIH